MKSKGRIIFRFCILAATGTGIFSYLKPTPPKEPSPEDIREMFSFETRELPSLDSYLESRVEIQEPYTDGYSYPDQASSTDTDIHCNTEEPEESLLFSDQELYSAYYDISGSALFDMYSDLESYFEQAGNGEIFTLSDKKNGEYSIKGGYDLDDVDKAYLSAEAKSEKDSLDQAFIELYPSLKEMASILEEIADYTNTLSFCEDNYESAQVYHTTLLKTYKKYMRALRLFVRELDAAQQ